jgi:ribosomal protein L6P/L9E
LKIRFKGKGYYIYKNYRNTVAPQFGYAHRVYVYAQAVSVKFLSKTKVLLFGLSKKDILAVGRNLKIVKPINIFTGRGVRFARQIIYRKTGKVSSYR